MDSCRRDDRSIRWIAQSRKPSGFGGNFKGEGKDLKYSTGLNVIEELYDCYLQPKLALAGENRDLQQADRTESYRLRATNRSVEYPGLFSRQLSGVGQPSNHDMGVEKDAR
jgi:hypothetical protein